MRIHNITASNVTEASFLLLSEIMLHGEFRSGEQAGGIETFKAIAAAVTIEEPLTDGLYPAIPAIIPCSYEELANYIVDVVEDARGFEVNYDKWAYTYGAAIVKQRPFVVKELRRCEYTRRAVMVISAGINELEDPPCLQELMFEVREDKLNMSVIFRSNDCCKAFPENLTALAYLQKSIAEELGLNAGGIYYFCPNVHVYQNDWKGENGEVSRAMGYLYRFSQAHTQSDRDALGMSFEDFNEIYEEEYPKYKEWCEKRHNELIEKYGK